MTGFPRITRDWIIANRLPPNAIKVAAKDSDAIVYLYDHPTKGEPCAAAFGGRRARPDWQYRFRTPEHRETHIRKHLVACAARANRPKERQKRKLEAGHILQSSWGYEQTNVDWFVVTRLIGKTMVEIQEIGSMDASDGSEAWATGKSLPNPEKKIGAPMRRKVHGTGLSVDRVRYASLWSGCPANWTAYG